MKPHHVAPYWGLRANADPGFDVEARARLFLPRMPERAFYFGLTAATLHRLPLPARFSFPTHLHVGVPAGARRVDALGIVAHHVRIETIDVTRAFDLPITSVARTWCDLAASGLTLAELVAAGDRVIWRRARAATRDDLSSAIGRYEGRRGSRLMRTAIELLDERSDSAPESEIRIAVQSAGLPPPEVNIELTLAGRVVRPDLSWPEQRIAIEYDGKHHRTERDQWHRDIRRDGAYRDAGWACYLATTEDYASPDRLLLWIARRMSR